MSIKSGSSVDAGDHEKNIVTYLEGINQATILSEDATVLDKVYTNAESETFSDSTGYNNFVDAGNTTAKFLEDRYILSSPLYDDFEDNDLDTDLWTKSEDNGTVTEVNEKIEIVGAAGSGVNELSSDTNYTDYLKWSNNKITNPQPTGNTLIYVRIGGTTIVDVGDNSPVYGDYTEGSTYEIFKVGASAHRLYENGVFVREIASALSGAVVFGTEANATDGGIDHFFDSVHLNFDSSAVVQTTAKTFAANIQEILLHANKDVSLSGTSVTFDISTDGGTIFEKTAQVLDTVIDGLDDDNTDVVLKITLNRGTTSTPWVFGYAYQGWTA